jgi:hypothetical protein
MTLTAALDWADDGSDLVWRAGHALRLPLRLTNTSAGARALVRIDEPSRHLAFELTAADGAARSFTGRDLMALAGDPTHEGVAVTDTLPAGASWAFTHALDAWAEPPARGRYVLRARYVAPDGAVAETPPRALDVVSADHVASGHARLASSGLYLAHALATPTAVSLRVAGYAAPRGTTFAFDACAWPGAGRVAVAQHAFSPRADPPLPAFRYWVVWHGDGRLGGARVDHQGAVEARFEVSLALDASARMLEPVQFEDGSMRVPLYEAPGGAARVVWIHVDAAGGCAVAGAQDLAPGAELVRVSAFADGAVALLWVDAARRALLGTPARTATVIAPPAVLARFDDAEVVWFEAIDGRRGVTALVVQSELVAGAQRLRVWRAAPGDLTALGEVLWAGAPTVSVRAVALPLGGAAVTVRGDDGALHLARLDGGGWTRVADVRCGLDHGVTAGPYGPIAWGDDGVEGLRFSTP